MTHNDQVTDYGTISSWKRMLQSSEPRSELYGYALMVMGCLFFDIISTAARASMVFYGLTAGNAIFLRGTSHIVYCLITTFLFFDPKEVFYVPRGMRFLLFMRTILGGVSLVLTYKALSLVSLGTVVSVFFMDPIFTMIIAAIFLGERMSMLEACGAFVCIFGVFFVANPTLELPQNLPSSYVIGISIEIVATLLYSIQLVLIRVLSSNVHYMTVTMAMGVPMALIGWAMGGADLPGATFGVGLLLVGSVFGFVGFLLIHKSLKYSRASTASLMQNIDLPFAYGLGVVFLGEIPHVMSLVGAFLVITGCIGIALDTRRKETEQLSVTADEETPV